MAELEQDQELQELVQRNIQDVLNSMQLDGCDQGAGVCLIATS